MLNYSSVYYNRFDGFLSLMASKENYFSTKKSTEELIMFIS